jgi:hypothetical protein
LKRAKLRRKWSAIPKQQHFTITAWRLFVSLAQALEIARGLVRFDVASPHRKRELTAPLFSQITAALKEDRGLIDESYGSGAGK